MQIKNAVKKLALSIIGVLILGELYSFENYLPGYIITLKDDTLKGFIDYRNWGHNPNEIFFKVKIESIKNIYKPNDIKEFGVGGDVYVSGIINSEISSSNLNDLEFYEISESKLDTVFLQAIFKGEKSLYYYLDKMNNRNLFIKQDGKFELLVYKKYLTEQDGKTIVTEKKKFITQLSMYFKDCFSIQSKLKNAVYNLSDIEDIFQEYYKCSGTRIDFHKKKERVSFEFGVLAGVSISSLKFQGNMSPYLVNVAFPQSYNFTAGIPFDIILPRNQKKWSIYNELLFTTFKSTAQYYDIKNDEYYSITNTKFEYSYIKLNTMLRFKYPIGHLFFFLNAGISNGFFVNEINYKHVKSRYYSTETNEEARAIDLTRKHEEGYVGGLGIRYKNYFCEMNYEKSNTMSSYSNLESKLTRLYFFAGFMF